MEGPLARGEFVRLAYRLGRGAATGALVIIETPAAGVRHQLYLRRGYLVAAQLSGTPSAVESETDPRRQAELRLERLAAIAEGHYSFNAHASAPAAATSSRGGLPMAITTWARRHIEARLDAGRARALAAELAGARLALRKNLMPEATECDDTDRRILAALATPRRLDEVEQAARAPRYRLLAFVHFLRAVGALDLVGVAAHPRGGAAEPKHRTGSARWGGGAAGDAQSTDPLASARVLLGLDTAADAEAVKRAYRRLARELHPDAHPGATDTARRALAVRFAQVADAYRALSR